MIGFMVVDTGDAPESYGNAVHTISGYNAATGAQNPQPTLVENLLILILRQVIGPMMIVQIMLMKGLISFTSRLSW